MKREKIVGLIYSLALRGHKSTKVLWRRSWQVTK
jgi:hypothetical protein